MKGYWQTGTLYELPILGVILMLAGIFLSPRHHDFLALVVLDLFVLFLPSLMDRMNRMKSEAEKKRLIEKCAKELKKSGLSHGLALHGDRSAGVAVFDSTAKRVAITLPEGPIEISI